MDEALRMLIEFLETASPTVWAAAQRQVAAESGMLWAWIGIMAFLFLLALGATVILAVSAARDSYDDGFGATMCGVIALVFLLVLVGIAARQYGMLNNPTWYAILKLRELLPK